MAKTIFITAFSGLSARNILSTSILEILGNEPDLRVIVLAPTEKKEMYQRDFAASKKNVVVEGISLKNVAMKTFNWRTASDSPLEKLFFSLFLNASDTDTRRVYRIDERRGRGFYFGAFFHWVLAKLSNLKIFRTLLRYLDFRLLPKNHFADYFEKYQPTLLFATDVFNEHDVNAMREARARRIKIAGMVRSWDNITSHGLNRIISDKLIVTTENIKREAVRYNDVPADKIFISGVPHYDRYITGKRTPREEFFKSLNLDPNKKTVLFAPPSDLFTENNPISQRVIKELGELENVQVIVRLYLVGGVNLGNLKPIENKLAIDAPPQSRHFVGVNLAPGEDAHLADLLYYSDVVILFASTLAIDAAVFKKPIVLLGFDGEPRPHWRSLRKYYDFDHQQYLLKTGGVDLPDNMEELMADVKKYLENPRQNESNREKVVNEFCWKLDGKSGERVANFLLGEIKNG